DAHTEAPTAGSVILAGVLLKMGTYGLIRFNLMLFPAASATFAPFVCVLAVIGIIYGALVAMVQTDIKKLVAYSSVSHLGFVVLGIFAFTQEALQGAVIQMINHGLSTGLLFMLIGMIYERRHTRLLSEYGGLKKQMPVFAMFFLIATLASVGLPGLNGFIGEFLILMGAFKSAVLGTGVYAMLGAIGVILSAVYMLPMFQKVFLGPLTNEKNKTLHDLDAREIALATVMCVFIVWIGIAPNQFMKLSEKSSQAVIEHVLKTQQVSQK
ncbi:MAG: NADH-quinone oxidoreductase subunit M, partial [Rhizobacter sp.]|nr:NADH-quinone oxidoreductase subunit M [Chlorobiales bacterium]